MKPFEIGVWVKMGDAPPRRDVYSLDEAKQVIEYAMGHSRVEDWGLFDPKEAEPAPSLEFTGSDHKRSQRVKTSDL